MVTGDQLEGAMFMGGLQLMLKIISLFKPDQNKKLEVDKQLQELKVMADEQEAKQEERMAPIWQRLLDQTNNKIDMLENRMTEAMNQIINLSVELAKSQTKASILEERVLTLEGKLFDAIGKHGADAVEIERLKTEVKVLQSELEDAQCKVIKAMRDLNDYKRITGGDGGSQPL